MQLAYPFEGDGRIALARKVLADHPGAGDEELISILRSRTEKVHSYPSWKLVLESARKHAGE